MPPKYQFRASDITKEKKIEEELNQLKVWYGRQALPFLAEEQLVIFLLFSNNNVQVAQSTIQNYFKSKSRAPELFSNLDLEAEDMEEACSSYDVAVIPRRTQDNKAIIFGKLKNTSYQSFHLDKLFKLGLMVGDLCLQKSPLDGIIAVFDMKGIGFLHLTRVRIGVVQKILQYIQEGFPCHIAEIHVLNTVSFIDKIILMVKPFIKKELYDAIRFHHSDEICDSFAKSYIPEDYGGILPAHKILTRRTYEEMIKLKMFYFDLEEQVKCFAMIK